MASRLWTTNAIRWTHPSSSSVAAVKRTTQVCTRGHSTRRLSQNTWQRAYPILLACGLATVPLYYLADGQLIIRSAHAETPVDEPALKFEKTKKRKGGSKEDFRDLISSQHHQVKKSWENPGLYAWGSNAGKVVAPDSDESYIKTPRRMSFFDGRLLRDLKLDKNFGAAISENGDLLQWGSAFSSDSFQPTVTLRGKNLVSLTVSRDRIWSLSSSGRVYSVPVSSEDQQAGTKPSESSWIPFWPASSPISYRQITPDSLGWNEKIIKMAGGLDHALLLTSKGRVFSAASASEAYPSRGQLGIPGLTWLTKPSGSYDRPHEITTLNGFAITKIACGDYHSLAVDDQGRVFTFGDNSSGQLGFEYSSESNMVDAPCLLPLQRLYPSSTSTGTSQTTVVTNIAAGGNNSYLTIEAVKRSLSGQKEPSTSTSPRQTIGRTTADTWAFGAGIYGALGNGRWTHVQSTPTKIPSLSGLFEYDEIRNVTIPIRLARLSVGATHAAAIMDNVTYLDASDKSSDADVNWGADVVWWGGNEQYQLGTGRRNNVNAPTYIRPLDAGAESIRAKSGASKEEHRFQITPRKTVRLGDGRTVSFEQSVECGRGCTAVYSRT